MKHQIIVLDAGTFYKFPSFKESLASLGDIIIYESTSHTEISERIKNATIVLTNKVILNEEVIENAKLLQLICVTATGMNNVDLEAASKRNIVVKNAKGYSTDSVAQTTFAMALHFLMQFKKHQTFVDNEYSDHQFFTHLVPGFSELKGKIWGIIGLGTIGKKVAEIACTFGCEVIYHSPSGKNLDTSYLHKSLPELLSTSDIISIHTPLNNYTSNLLDYNNLKLCKNTAILINVARGGIIDERGLKQILEEDLLAGVASDVFSTEPIKVDNPLLQVKNKEKILLTPHIAWGSFEARQNLMEITKKNIISFLTSGN